MRTTLAGGSFLGIVGLAWVQQTMHLPVLWHMGLLMGLVLCLFGLSEGLAGKPLWALFMAGLGQGLATFAAGRGIPLWIVPTTILASILAWVARPRRSAGLVPSDAGAMIVIFVIISLALSLNLKTYLQTQALSHISLSLLVFVYLMTPPIEIVSMLFVLYHARDLSAFVRRAYGAQRQWARLIVIGLVTGMGVIMLTSLVTAAEHKLLHVAIQSNNPFIFNHHLVGVWIDSAILASAVVILAPIAEEAVFRGVLFGTLQRFWPPLMASIVAAVIFGAAHLNLALFLPLAIAGFVFNTLYQRSRSLIPSTVAHATLNGLSVAIAWWSSLK